MGTKARTDDRTRIASNACATKTHQNPKDQYQAGAIFAMAAVAATNICYNPPNYLTNSLRAWQPEID